MLLREYYVAILEYIYCSVVVGNEPVFKNKKILLLEAAAQKKRHQLPDSFNSRVCALSGGSVRLLESMLYVTFIVFFIIYIYQKASRCSAFKSCLSHNCFTRHFIYTDTLFYLYHLISQCALAADWLCVALLFCINSDDDDDDEDDDDVLFFCCKASEVGRTSVT